MMFWIYLLNRDAIMLRRNLVWIVLGMFSVLLLKPAIAEINTLLLIVLIECVALSLSGVALFVYSKIDFTQNIKSNNIGLIFLGVHICIGLVVIGVYIAQI